MSCNLIVYAAFAETARWAFFAAAAVDTCALLLHALITGSAAAFTPDRLSSQSSYRAGSPGGRPRRRSLVERAQEVSQGLRCAALLPRAKVTLLELGRLGLHYLLGAWLLLASWHLSEIAFYWHASEGLGVGPDILWGVGNELRPGVIGPDYWDEWYTYSYSYEE